MQLSINKLKGVIMNNFDQSSTGVNLELHCFYDCDLSRIYFDDNFQKDGYLTDHFQFIDYGNHKVVDLLDLDNYKYTKQMIIEGLLSYFNCSIEHLGTHFLNDHGFYLSKATKTDLIEYVETSLYHSSDIIKFYIDNFDPLFEVITIYGHSQGDQVDIIFSFEAMKEYTFQDREKFIDTMQEYFTNLFYNAPVYCRLEINGNELYFDEYIKDQYCYDKNEILQIADKQIDHQNKKYILEWLDQNLPVYPDYK